MLESINGFYREDFEQDKNVRTLLIPFSSTDTQGLEGMFARIKSFATNVTE